MENLHYLLLEELYLRYGARTGTSLNAFIRKLGREPSDLQFTIDIKVMLIDLESNGIITWLASSNFIPDQNNYWYREHLGTTSTTGHALTFDNVYVEVQLTPNKGLEYAGNLVNREVTRQSTIETNASVRELNNETKKFYNSQRGFTIAIVTATIATALIALLTYVLPHPNNNKEVERIENKQIEIKKEVDSLHALLDRLKSSQNTSPISPSISDTSH